VLSPFTPGLQERAKEQLAEMGVQIRAGQRVTTIDAGGVVLDGKDRIAARTVLWAAGVRGTRLAETLGVPLDRQGRVIVETDASLPGHPNVFAIGDMAAFPDGKGTLPGLCPVAMQQGRYVAELIRKDTGKEQRKPFAYVDKGTMATIGRSRAIAQAGRMQMSGFLAWLAWLFVHIMFLIGFRNRFVVLFTWAWSYISFQRGARLITMRNTDTFGRTSKPEAT
jgi:NADH dehydrogenase